MSRKVTRRDFVQAAALSGLAVAATPPWTGSAFDGKGEGPSGSKKFTDFVDVFIGTGGHGHTYPGATVPFGMVQLSPDTFNGGWDHCSGYHHDDTSIMGFSHTHLSGTGAADLLDVLLMPGTGPVRLNPGSLENPKGSYRSTFSHAEEKAEPGYYSVLLKDYGVKAELTATARVGVHRYTFPADPTSHFLIDLAHGVIDPPKRMYTNILSSELRVVGNDMIVGGRRVNEWAPGRYIFFAMKFSKPFASTQLYSDDKPMGAGAKEANGTSLKCSVNFPTAKAESILVKVGLSAVSVEGATKNMEREVPGWDFDAVRKSANAAWEKELGKIEIETSRADHKKIFYTAMYHSFVAPTMFSDVDGQYRGSDLQVHKLPDGANNYSTYSLWDTYRALHPMYTLVQTERLPDLLNAMILMAEQSPAGVPVWPLQAVETGCMIGYHSAPVLAEAQAKGIRGIDYAKAYPLWRKRAMDDDYRGLGYYRKMGYIPCDLEEEAVSKTLEYAYDDWAVAHLARVAGREDDYKLLLQRSRNYENTFDGSTTFMRGRLADGQWAEPFDPRGMGHSKKWRDFTESNSWQATFLNQHDLYEYMKLFGGEKGFVIKLDTLFNQSSELPPDAPPDIAGMVGQYAHGNEPGHHVAYLYAYAGEHYKAQARVRMLLETMYHNDPDGLAGNEDCGQMSAWYVLSALGFYAVDPVSGNYVFGGPLFERATIHLANGKKLEIEAPGNRQGKTYVQSVTWNGKPCTKSWFSHAQIAEGGEFVITMGEKPNEKFGAAMEDRPPSFA
ncbi:MAG TPA: GH92 family glycosyl hydrolase [Candidatus Saccharimonadales bacterium]|nr:GH92 family glycosyl hydrolase [Candidatus Saccharimonadales bacterium]